MKLTNTFNLPEPIVQAVQNDAYTAGSADISVTQLLDPPQKVALIREHADEIEEDVSDRIFSLMGQAVHNVLERAEVPGLQEERLYADFNGWTLSGQFDYLDEDGLLWDWKTASTYELSHGVKESREQQLNCYAELARQNGMNITGLRVGFILRDWSKRGQYREANYPPHQVVVYPIPLWDGQRAKNFIEDRISLHQSSQYVECTDEERWAQPTRFAVVKQGAKRASKVFDTRAEAEEYATGRGTGYFVDVRAGANIRCESYCGASAFCTQWAALRGRHS